MRQTDHTGIGTTKVFGHFHHKTIAEDIVLTDDAKKSFFFNAIDNRRFDGGNRGVVAFIGNKGTESKQIVGLKHADNLYPVAYAFFIDTEFATTKHHHVRRNITLIVDDFVFAITTNLNMSGYEVSFIVRESGPNRVHLPQLHIVFFLFFCHTNTLSGCKISKNNRNNQIFLEKNAFFLHIWKKNTTFAYFFEKKWQLKMTKQANLRR